MECEDIVGRRVSKLTVVRFLRKVPYQKRSEYWYECRCDCGNVLEVRRGNLIRNHTKSCGCLKKRKASKSPCWGGHGEISGRLWGHIKNHAHSRKLEFRITLEEAWELFQVQEGKCALTGLPLSLVTPKGKGPSAKSASLDRIDSGCGYVKGNIQWVHKRINRMKMDLDQDYFIELCRAVAAHNGG